MFDNILVAKKIQQTIIWGNHTNLRNKIVYGKFFDIKSHLEKMFSLDVGPWAVTTKYLTEINRRNSLLKNNYLYNLFIIASLMLQ